MEEDSKAQINQTQECTTTLSLNIEAVITILKKSRYDEMCILDNEMALLMANSIQNEIDRLKEERNSLRRRQHANFR